MQIIVYEKSKQSEKLLKTYGQNSWRVCSSYATMDFINYNIFYVLHSLVWICRKSILTNMMTLLICLHQFWTFNEYKGTLRFWYTLICHSEGRNFIFLLHFLFKINREFVHNKGITPCVHSIVFGPCYKWQHKYGISSWTC